MTEKNFHIKGMDCNEEVVALKKDDKKLVGSEDNLEFDLINAKLKITFPADTPVGDEEIKKAVAAAGLKAEPWVDDRQKDGNQDESFRERHGRAVMCGLSGILIIGGFLNHTASNSFLTALAPGAAGESIYPALSIALYLGAVASGAWYIAPKAVLSARRFRPDMNLLMSVAAIGAIILGEYLEAAAVTFLFAASLLLESWSIGRARNAIKALANLSPLVARFKYPGKDELIEKPVAEVPVGSTVVVRPGEKIPLDGVITKGATRINQAPITGEPMPVEKSEGDEVFAGTINGDGSIEFRSVKQAEDTTIARIIKMVEKAQSRKAPSEQWVEKFARYYTPSMIALSLFIAVALPVITGGGWSKWFYEALVILVIACPCALVISTPVSIVAGLTSAARSGVLVKGGAFLEAPAHLQAVALDKTGTVTYGKPSVKEIITMDNHTEAELLMCAASLEAHSTHPLATAIIDKAESLGIPVKPADAFSLIQGKGAEGVVNGKNYWIGSHRFMHEKGMESPEFHDKAEALEAEGKSVVAIGTDDHVCGIIGLEDKIRNQTKSVITALKKLGIKHIVMLTGDNRGTAETVAKEIGVDRFESDLLPEDKVDIVKQLMDQYGKVAMIGDGVNDAPALATSTVGIAMGAAGSDAAIETADISLMSDDLSKLPWLVGFSRRTLRIIKRNIAFALGLKFVFIVLALLGMASLWMAIAADMGATFVVIMNSLRLLDGKT
ncbi:heavy metal translocating P-type ATPase [candidate division KSB1 bacterium]|nr:heavy metal translocating P-type ATPase [candidate division KSB1 bacterium]